MPPLLQRLSQLLVQLPVDALDEPGLGGGLQGLVQPEPGHALVLVLADTQGLGVVRLQQIGNLGIENTTGLVTVYNTASQGTVKLNTLNLDLDQWSGNYFTAYNVTATAVPKEGVTFTGWEVTDSTGSTKTYNDTTISVPVTGGVTIKANYSGSAVETTKPPKEETTQAPTTQPVQPTQPTQPAQPGATVGSAFYGDANLDGKVNVSDAVAVLQFVANQTKYPIQEQGLVNADIDGASGITGSDAIVIQKVDAGVVKQSDLPLKK